MGPQIAGTWYDYLIVIAYFVGILLFGAYFAKYSKSTKDFFFGGQRFAWWLIAASLVATGIGSYSYLKYAQAGFNQGMSSTLTYLNDWFMIPLFMFGWLPIIYFSRIKSIPEYFERRFNSWARHLATLYTLLYLVGYVGLNFFLLGQAIHGLMPFVSVYQAAIAVAIVTAIYVTAGGQTAVIFTDLIQGIFLYLAGAILLVLGIMYVGGIGEWWTSMDVAHRLPLPGFNESPDFNFAGIFWGEGIIGTLAFTFVNQGFIMRYLAVKDVFEGRKCLTFNTLILMPISAIVVGNVGWIAYSMWAKGQMPLADNFDTRDIFIHASNIICKPGVFGFIIAALTAALMSTVDTLINACTAIAVYDVYKPATIAINKKESPDKHYLLAARVFSILFSLIGLLLVPIFANSKSIFTAHYAFVAMVAPAMLVPIFLGVIWKRFTPTAAIVSMTLGGAAVLYSWFTPQIITPLASTHGISKGNELLITWHTEGDNPWPLEVRQARTKTFPGQPDPRFVVEFNTDAARSTKPFEIPAAEVRVNSQPLGNDTEYRYVAAFNGLTPDKNYIFRVSGAKGYGRYAKDVQLPAPANFPTQYLLAWDTVESDGRPVNVRWIDSPPWLESEQSWQESRIASAMATSASSPFPERVVANRWQDEFDSSITRYAAKIPDLIPRTRYNIRVGDLEKGFFSWDAPFKTGGEYQYFRGVFGLLVVLILAIVVSLFTKPKPEEQIVGLTLWTIQKQKEIFKGGKVNEIRGKPVQSTLQIDNADELLHLSRKAMEQLKAAPGDLMYIADGRAYLGGLRSLHIHLGQPHDRGDAVLLSEAQVTEGNLLMNRPVRVEKVF